MAATPLGQGRPQSADPDMTSLPSARAAGVRRGEGGWRDSAPLLEECAVTIEDGLLMVFGPEGDPLPPGALRSVLHDQPDLMLALADGQQVAAARVMAVLEAQSSGRLGPDDAPGDSWILAMLGLGPQPDEISEAALLDEPDGGYLTAFGNELMVALPAGGALLITDAKAPGPRREAIGLFLDDGTALAIGDLIERLRDVVPGDDPDLSSAGEAEGEELMLPDCWVQLDDDALALDFPRFGRVRLAPFESGDSEGPQVTVFLPDGRVASMADLLTVVDGVEEDAEQSRCAEDESLDPADHFDDECVEEEPSCAFVQQAPVSAAAPVEGVSGEEVHPAGMAGSASDELPTDSPNLGDAPRHQRIAPPDQVIALSAHLPAVDGVEPPQLALLVVRGVPRGGALSAGIDNGDGSWLLSPAELEHLTLILPADSLRPSSLPVSAIAVADRDGALATVSGTLRLADPPPLGRKTFGRRHTEAVNERPVPLALGACIGDLEGIDAVVIRDVPRGARLSAGTYDAAIDGWVLRRGQLAGLELIAMPGRRGDCTLTILGISLRSGGPAHPRVLGRLPVALS